jgi:hypothetical protein
MGANVAQPSSLKYTEIAWQAKAQPIGRALAIIRVFNHQP